MAGNFLTPTAVWKDFSIQGDISAEVLKEYSEKGVAFVHLRIGGRKVADGQVGIYAVMTRKAQLTVAPALVVVQDLANGTDLTLARFFAEQGYTVLTVDLAGETENATENKNAAGFGFAPYTIYPESLKYANYDPQAEDIAEISGNAYATCWFEWGRVIRYAVEYLKRQPLITKVGVLGVNAAATPLWQVLSASCGISAAVIVGNAGWKGYRGIDKFGDKPEPQFGDDALKYLAGVEPQAYATHVKCPVMVLSPTNSPVYDFDRAYDTVSRVPSGVYRAIDYSVGGREQIDFDCFNGAVVFFNELLVKDAPVLAKEISVKSAFVGNAVRIEVSPDLNGLKELFVYCAEEELSPARRAWYKITGAERNEKGVYAFTYTPYNKSGAVMFFARAGYENGFHICSVVSCRKFGTEIGQTNLYRVYYSSRMTDGENGFYPAVENVALPRGIDLDKDDFVRIKSGHMSMYGLYCKRGILTFKINGKKFKPLQGSILMTDVCVKGGGTFCVKAIVDYFGKKTEYSAQVKIFGDLWQNVKFELNNFKTAEGMGLKTYDNVQALEFSADGEFMINNLLWL
ncbi:MAG: hypothetical protein IJU83_00870 [Clostridia bacterium]|nr:hypothetical protein [Clostridia bacterium]